MLTLLLFLCLLFVSKTYSIDLSDLNVPPEHVPYVFNAYRNLAKSCIENPKCPHKALADVKVCWGYELNCNKSKSYHVRPRCPGDHRGWVKTKEAQYDTFFTQADFGKLK